MQCDYKRDDNIDVPSRKESENAGCTASYSMIDDDITTRYLKQKFKL